MTMPNTPARPELPEPSITVDELRSLIRYEPETGLFFWKIRPYRSNIQAGAKSGTPSGRYLTLKVKGHSYLCHRLAWFYMNGEWPDGLIDHINGIGTDNRICNLRVVTYELNSHNRRLHNPVNKTCGLLGASKRSDISKWTAAIKHRGKSINLGHFDTAEEAHAAYLAAKSKYHAGYIPPPKE